MKQEPRETGVVDAFYLLTDEEIGYPIQVLIYFFEHYGKRPGPGVPYSIDDFFFTVGAAVATGAPDYLFVEEGYLKLVVMKLEQLIGAAALIYNQTVACADMPDSRFVSDAISRFTPRQLADPKEVLRKFFKDLNMDGVKSALCEVVQIQWVPLNNPNNRGAWFKYMLFEGHLNQLVEACFIIYGDPLEFDPPVIAN
jgi:hypothetical protein